MRPIAIIDFGRSFVVRVAQRVGAKVLQSGRRAVVFLLPIFFAVLGYPAAAQADTYFYDALDRLVRVEYDGGSVITYTYDAAGNRTARTVFNATTSPFLTVSLTGSGTVTSNPPGITCAPDCSKSFAAGTSVTLTASPPSGSTFSGWGGVCSSFGTQAACTVTVDANKTATANFGGTLTIPGVPTGVTAVAGNARATVSFTVPVSNGGSPITGYTVTSTPAGGVDSNGGTTSTTHLITGLVNGTPYTFTVRATNAVGPGVPSAPSNSVTPSTAATTAPGAPTGVTAATGNAQAIVNFTAPADNGGSPITGYTVTSTPAGGVDSNAGTTSTTHLITGLVNGTPYTFTVRATNAVGPGLPSAPSNSVTPSATAVARLSFSVPTLNAGSAAVGQTLPGTLTLSNTGGGAATLQVSIAGQDFALNASATTCGGTLAGGASCNIGVAFTPTAVGARSATLAVASNAPGSPTTAALTGTGTSPPTGSETSRSAVQKAYVAYYGRAADPAGLDYWATQLDAAGSLNAIIVPFGNSKEFITRYGGLTNTQLVTKIYQQTLARNPDQGGLDYYVGELSAGRRSLQSITLDVVFGATTPPDSTVVANKLDVAAYYTAKVAAGCPYGSELDGVNALVGVTSSPASVTGAKAGINFRCGP